MNRSRSPLFPSRVDRIIAVVVFLFASLVGHTPTRSQGPGPDDARSPIDSVRGVRQRLIDGDLATVRLAAKATLELTVDEQIELLPELIDLLSHHRDGQVRLALLDTLTQMGPSAQDAVPALVASMGNRFSGNRNERLHQDYRVAWTLASIGVASIDPLRGLLTHESANVRAEAAMALGRIGPAASAAVDDLIGLLGDDDPSVRSDAVTSLGHIGRAAVDPLLRRFDDPDPLIRAAALQAAAAADPDHPRVVRAVRDAINDPEALVRSAATGLIDRVTLTREEQSRWLLDRIEDQDQDVAAAAVDAAMRLPGWVGRSEADLAELLLGSDDDAAWRAAFLISGMGRDAAAVLLDAADHEAGRIDQLARALTLIRQPIVNDLIAALDGGSPGRRQAAARALGEMRPIDTATIPALVTHLQTAQGPWQLALLEAIADLEGHGVAALNAVRPLTSDSRAEVRLLTIQILSRIAPSDQWLADLGTLITDPDAAVQRAAIDALLILGPAGRGLIPSVTALVDSPAASVRESTLAFLGSHAAAASSAVPKLVERLAATTQSPERVAVITTLGQIGPAAQPAQTLLIDLMDDPDANVRRAALQALSALQLPITTMRPLLMSGLADADEAVRAQAAGGIRRLGPGAATLVPDLIQSLSDERVRQTSERLLKRLERYPTDPTGVPALVQLLGSADPNQVIGAIQFLGRAGVDAADAAEPLERLTEHADPSVKRAAREALQQIAPTHDGH